MAQWLNKFWREEDGQDIVEYSLLITFIAIATMWVVGAGRPVVNAIWVSGNQHLASANTAAQGQ